MLRRWGGYRPSLHYCALQDMQMNPQRRQSLGQMDSADVWSINCSVFRTSVFHWGCSSFSSTLIHISIGKRATDSSLNLLDWKIRRNKWKCCSYNILQSCYTWLKARDPVIILVNQHNRKNVGVCARQAFIHRQHEHTAGVLQPQAQTPAATGGSTWVPAQLQLETLIQDVPRQGRLCAGPPVMQGC